MIKFLVLIFKRQSIWERDQQYINWLQTQPIPKRSKARLR